MALQPGLGDPRDVGLRPGEGGEVDLSLGSEGGESISWRRAAVAHAPGRTLTLPRNITLSEHLSLLSIQHYAHTAHTCCSTTLPSPPSTSPPSLLHHHHFSTASFPLHCTSSTTETPLGFHYYVPGWIATPLRTRGWVWAGRRARRTGGMPFEGLWPHVALARGTAGTCREKEDHNTATASLFLSHSTFRRVAALRAALGRGFYRVAFSALPFSPPGGGLFAAACPHVAAGKEARGRAVAVFMSRPNQQLPHSARHAQRYRNNLPLFSRPPSPPEMALSLPLVRPGHCPCPRADLHSDGPPCPPSPLLPPLLISTLALSPRS